MKKLVLGLMTLAISASTFAFHSGDRIICADDVSGLEFKIKIIDLGDEAASAKVVKNNKTIRSYGPNRVVYRETTEGAIFRLIAQGQVREELEIESAVETGTGLGFYVDHGDSRSISCILK